MIRNFYQTPTGRSYQYGTTETTSITRTNNIVSNQSRYSSTAVAYIQFSPLTSAGIRQIRLFLLTINLNLFFLFVVLHDNPLPVQHSDWYATNLSSFRVDHTSILHCSL